MKTIHLLVVLGCFALGNAAAVAVSAPTLMGLPQIDVHATSQNLFDQQVSAKTNVIRGATNDVTVNKSTTTNFTINATSLLALLEASFNTNFPTGTQLLLSGSEGYYSFVVSDQTGTNASPFAVSQVLQSLGFSGIHSGIETELLTNQVFSSGNDTESFTEALSFQYDDSALTNTVGGVHTSFSWNCLIEVKSSNNLGTGALTENVTMTLTGGGQIRSRTNSVFTGTIRAKLTGHRPVT
ncbi:MAG TPA: hypothetical protein VKV04_12660 [Verrucomicrobiae bacterium]|nr:hypothetical protein [Verrucomicrobiae bacterium]